MTVSGWINAVKLKVEMALEDAGIPEGKVPKEDYELFFNAAVTSDKALEALIHEIKYYGDV